MAPILEAPIAIFTVLNNVLSVYFVSATILYECDFSNKNTSLLISIKENIKCKIIYLKLYFYKNEYRLGALENV
jgi:hypothetical protein